MLNTYIIKTLKKCLFSSLATLLIICPKNTLADEYNLPTALGDNSEFLFFEVPAPDESQELPVNVVKYYNPNLDNDVHYYQISFKNPEKGSGPATKYFKWVQTANGLIHLEETANPDESVLIIHYDPAATTEKTAIASGEEIGEINQEYYASEVNNAIDINGSVEEINTKYAGNTVTITPEDTHNYSALIIEADAAAEFINASYIGNQVFINASKSIYGPLLKTLSRIGDLAIEMIGNKITTNTYLNGGLLETPQSGRITSIVGDFIGNSTTSSSANIDGGVIGNEGTIDTIKNSTFMKNIIYTLSGKASGGALYNSAFQLINGIKDSVFSGNAAISDNNTAAGGAIYNNKNGSITNSIFIDNYAQSQTDKAKGGAIFTSSDLAIYATEGKTTEFSGNYVINAGTKENQAIYVDSNEAKLTLSATDGGKVILNDAITGERNFGTILTGDDTGTIYLNSSITNSKISAANTNITLINNKYENYDFLNLSSQDSAKWGIDINFNQNLSDKLSVGSGSSGILMLNKLNILGGQPTAPTTIQIINSADGQLKLELSDSLKAQYAKRSETDPRDINDPIAATTAWDKVYYTQIEYKITTEGLRAVKSNTSLANEDSIEYYIEQNNEILDHRKQGDTLRLVNQLEEKQRYFMFDSADDIYISEDNTGTSATGTLNVIGVHSDQTNKNSTINAGEYTLFELSKEDEYDIGTQLNLRDVNLTTQNAAEGALINNIQLGNISIYGKDIILTGVTGTNGIINNNNIGILGSVTSNTGITGASGVLQIGNNSNFGSLTLTDGASINQYSVTIFGDTDHRRFIYFDENGTLKTTSNNIQINAGGDIFINASNLLSNVTNNGRLHLRDGILSSTITSTDKGVVWLSGNIELAADSLIKVDGVAFETNNSSLTTNADNLKTKIYKESSLTDVDTSTLALNLTGGTLTAAVKVGEDFNTNILNDTIFENTGERSFYSNILVNDGAKLTVNNFSIFDGNSNNQTTLTNNGNLEIKSGGVYDTNHSILIRGDGITHITGKVINNYQAQQSEFYIDEGATLTTHPAGIMADKIVNNGTWKLYSQGSSLTTAQAKEGSINGSGTIEIITGSKDGYTFIDGVKINQDLLVSGARLYIRPEDLNGTEQEDGALLGTVTNNANLILYYTDGQTLKKDIYGSGTLNVGRDTINQGHIYNTLAAWGATPTKVFTTNANLLHGNIITNYSTNRGMVVALTGGTLDVSATANGYNLGGIRILSGAEVTTNKNIATNLNVQENAILHNHGEVSGIGTLTITGTMNNDGDLTIKATEVAGTLNTGASHIKSETTIKNGGIINLDDGTLNGTINGTNGTINIIGNVINDSYRLYPSIKVTDTGIFTTDASLLYNTTDIENNNLMLLNGKLSNNINNNGTIKIQNDKFLELTHNDSINKHGNFTGGTFDLNNGTLSTDRIDSYNLAKATGSGNLSLNLNTFSQKADLFILNDDSDAVFNINNLEVYVYRSEDTATGKIQILKGKDGSTNHNAYLTLTKRLSSDEDGIRTFSEPVREIVDGEVTADAWFDDIYGVHRRTGTIDGFIRLDTTDTENDSIFYQLNPITWIADEVITDGLLRAWNTEQTVEENKYFRFRTAQDVYQMIRNAETSASINKSGDKHITMNILGVADDEGNKSTIEHYREYDEYNEQTEETQHKTAYYSGIKANDVTLNIKNVRFQNAKDHFLTGYKAILGAYDSNSHEIRGGLENVDFINGRNIYATKINTSSNLLNFSDSTIYQIKDSTFKDNILQLTNTDSLYANPTFNSNVFLLTNSYLGTSYTTIDAETGEETTTYVGGILNTIFDNNLYQLIDTKNQTFANGTLNLDNSEITNIAGSKFTNNKIIALDDEIHGNALILRNNSIIHNITDTEFSNNSIEGNNAYGSAIDIRADSQIDLIKDSLFANNTSTSTDTGIGGAIFIDNATIDEINHTVFDNNIAKSHAGAIYIRKSTIGKIINSTFSNNQAEAVSGGAFYITQSTIDLIENSTFDNNTAETAGGALMLSNTGPTKIKLIKDSTFSNNKTKSHMGGAIYIFSESNSGSTIDEIYNSKFLNNVAGNSGANNQNGGAIAIAAKGTLSKISGDDVDVPNIIYSERTLEDGSTERFVDTEKNYQDIFKSQFIGNIAQYDGGAIYQTSGRTIDEISNTLFEANRTIYTNHYGSAIHNRGVIKAINNVVFQKNGNNGGCCKVAGGAIYQYSTGKINSITNTAFLGNYEKATGTANNIASGGAIYSDKGTIGIIDNVVFAENYASRTGASGGSWVGGGAITLIGSPIDTLSNTKFINNHSYNNATSQNSWGGAIMLTDTGASITNFENNYFEGNYTHRTKSTADRAAQGGAIALTSSSNGITNGIINSRFINNYARGTAAFGGALYIAADNTTIYGKNGGLSEFSGNHIQNSAGSKTSDQAIYVADPTLTLNLNANTNGRILMNDSIEGANGFTTHLTGDSSGLIELYGTIRNSHVVADNVNIKTADNILFDHNFITLTTDASAKWNIDIDFGDAKKADNFTLKQDSTGTLYLNNINEINKAAKRTKVQVLKTNNDNIRLAVNNNNINIVNDIIETLGDTTYNNVTYLQEEGYALGTTDTYHDSLTGLIEEELDALNIIASSTNNLSRNFIFRDESTYNVKTDLDRVAKGELNIIGRSDGSVIDTNQHSMFKVTDTTTFNISNIDFLNQNDSDALFTVSSDNTIINLTNVNSEGNFIGSKKYTLNILGNKNSISSIYGTVTNANTTIDNGHFYFSTDTFAATNNNLTTNNASMQLNDLETSDYTINEIHANQNTNWYMDFDLSNQKIDTIATNSAESNGFITIKEFNYLNGSPELSPFTTQVIKAQNDSLQLKLADDINHYKIKDISKLEDDRVKETTIFSDQYWHRKRLGRLLGELELATTDTTNDSIYFYTKENWDNDTTPIEMIDDTLKMINQATYEERYFESYDANEVYNLSTDMGQTAAGTFTINGSKENDDRSTINLAGNDGFEIGADTSLKINNTRLTGNTNVITVTDSNGEVSLNNADIDGNIVGQEHFNLTVRGEDATTINGKVINSDVTLDKGKLFITSDTFADGNTNLNAEAGSIMMNNGEIETYTFNNLISGDNTKYTIDLNLKTLESDIIKAEGNGLITLEEFNIIGMMENIDINETYRIQILETSNDDLQLTLSETVMSQLDQDYNLGTNHIILKVDSIGAHTMWDDEYEQQEQDQNVWGRLNLASTKTKNDSLLLYHLWIEEPVVTTKLGDTLRLINWAEFDEPKTFTFDAAENVYKVKERLGGSAEGTLSIIGVADENNNKSTIDMQKILGFDLSKQTELNISDVNIVNASYRQGSIANITNENAVLNLNNVTITKTKSSNAIQNDGTVNMTDGSIQLDSGITGNGKTNITGAAVSIADNINLTQDTVNVENGTLTMGKNGIIRADLTVGEQGSVTIGLNGIISEVENNGNITFNTSGTLSQDIYGNGTTHTTENTTVNATINNNIDIKSNSLTATAEQLTQNINVNDGANLILSGNLGKNITGLGTTTVNRNLTLSKNAGTEGTINLNNGEISAKDDQTNAYNFGKMIGNGNFAIDIDPQKELADTFNVGNASTGTINITELNILNPSYLTDNIIIQVLNSNGGENISIALSDEVKSIEHKVGRTSRPEQDEIKATTAYDELYHNYIRGGDLYGKLKEATTLTTNDSITIVQDDSLTKWDEKRNIKDLMGDTLKLWNELDVAEKNFNFSSANDNYKLGAKVDVADVGVTKGETVAINGVSAANDETTKATIDFNNKAGFVLNDETALAINNAKLTAAQNDAVITINHSDATVTLNNAYVDGNIDGSQNFALTIDGSRTTTLNGTATNANTELKAGTLTFNTDTFAASSDTLSTSGGTVALNNNTIETYDIYQLDSNQTTYTLDLDLNNRSADMLHITEGTGSVTLGKFNLIGNILDPDIIDQTYKIKILNVESGDIQLTLDDQSSSQLDGEYFLGKTTTTSEDSIASNTPWDKTYWNYKQDTLTYGQLGLATTKTTNDSIGINISKQIITDKIKTDPMGDTLHLVNISDENTDKSFDFDDADNKYIQQENLGETSGNITINGKKEQETTSSIDMNGHSGFEITDNNNKITITNTSIENAQAQQGSVINVTATEATISLTNTNLLNNKATGEHGAAIYSNSNVELTADNYDITIKDNNTARTNEAIFMDNNSTLTLNAQNNGSITINDKINGTAGFSVKLDGDKSGEITLTDKIDNAQINMSDITLNLSGNEHFANSNFNALSGTINLINDKAETQIAKAMGIKGEIIVNVDADLKTLTMDRLANNTTITKDGFIHVDRINLLSDSTSPEIAIPFATPLIKDQTDYIGNNTVSKNTQVTQAFAPIYQYDVYYDNRKDMGYFVFKNTKKFNPSVLASSVASQAGSFTAISKTLDYSFEHADYYMNRSNNSKQLIRSTDHNNNRTPFVNKLRQEAIWAQPYGGKEDINLDNGPKVEVKSHGILAGADSNVKDISTNWSTATTFYAGYNGTHQRYNGIKIQQGGGVAGLTQSFYNHNFFTALTATAGFNRNKVKTMYGNEYFNSYVTGMASKTGYNLEFMHGKYIIQPTMQLAYSYIHTSKYKNKADVNISSDNLETIQIHPEIKFIANLPEFQPYASIGYVYNITDSTDFKANRIELPEMSVKPYMEYGLGFQKTWEKDLYGFMETTIKTGGREGIDFTIGIRGSL